MAAKRARFYLAGGVPVQWVKVTVSADGARALVAKFPRTKSGQARAATRVRSWIRRNAPKNADAYVEIEERTAGDSLIVTGLILESDGTWRVHQMPDWMKLTYPPR